MQTDDQTLDAFVRWPVEWDALDEMQSFAKRYARRRWPAPLAERATLTACELLENAVRYAIVGGAVDLGLTGAENQFEVRVANDAIRSRMQLLETSLRNAAGPSSSERYAQALRRVWAGQSPKPGGFGLLRIRHESDAEISHVVVGTRVTVIACGVDHAAREDRDGIVR